MGVIRTKRQMYALLDRGALGNKLRTWATLEELERSGFAGLIGIRSLRVGGRFLNRVPAREARRVVAEHNLTDYVLGESAPDESITIQGEVQRSERHLDVTFSRQKCAMRQALRESPEYASGLAAATLLKWAMSPADLDDVEELLDGYADAVVEFTCFSRNVGATPGRNTVIWEVRNY